MDSTSGKTRRPSLTATQAYKTRTHRASSGAFNVGPSHHFPSIGGGTIFTGIKRRSTAGTTFIVQLEDNKMWSNAPGRSMGLIPGRATAGPLALLLCGPSLALTIYRLMAHHNGSIGLFLFQTTRKNFVGFLSALIDFWLDFQSGQVWRMIFYFLVFELIISKLIPGKVMQGPVTPAGNQPLYRLNGFQCFILSVAVFLAGAQMGYYPGGVIFDKMGQILASMNILALIVCGLLYHKGLNWPSSSDYGSAGNEIFDYYWGTELHPRILGCDVKQFFVCRVSMTFWALTLLSCAYKQYENHGQLSNAMLINVLLQLTYITKFFVWESGYMCTLDMCHDRAGFYLCWGVMVWLPAVHTSPTVFLVENSPDIGILGLFSLISLGLACIFVNFDCDRQKQEFRRHQGRLKVWGADPVFIEAKYKTENDETKTNLLLASGYWGMSRHFHYLPELGASLCWTLPVGFGAYAPHFYAVYLTVLLVDRAYRDDARCRAKYGKFWDQYCSHVPHKLIPGLW